MNKTILNTGVQEYIEKNQATDILAVALGNSPFEYITPGELAQQINGKQKSRKKLPLWHAARGIYYPKALHLEQASSEVTARYKAGLVSGTHLLDLTGGMGIDTYYFSRRFKEVTYCEKDLALAEIAEHNFKVLKAENIAVFHGDGMACLENSGRVDCIYIDPSRRDSLKNRVFVLADCEPPVPEILPLLQGKSNKILLKAAPLLDISAALNELEYVSEIHVVAVQNEVKELLFIMEQGFRGETQCITVNLKAKGDEVYTFLPSEEKMARPAYGLVPQYLYQPNAAIMKAGAFKGVGRDYGLVKLHRNSHLYTSEKLIDFPGRRYKITAVHPYKKSALKKRGYSSANIATRNFPIRAKELYQRMKIKPGGATYLFFTTDNTDKKIVIECTKIR